MQTLARRQLLDLQDLGPADIAVLDGRVWITRHKDGTDYVLGAGESLHLPASSRAVVSALDPARVVVTSRAPARASRTWAWGAPGLSRPRT